MKYVIVIPAKNEENFIEETIRSIISQTIKPLACLFVDDNSNDRTPEIIAKYVSEIDYMNTIRLEENDEADYQVGGHVVEIFNAGKKYLDEKKVDYDYIVKLDADISFEKDFFEKIFPKLRTQRYGIVSGTPYYFENGKKIYDLSPKFHSRGQFKIYNKNCIDDIGGIPSSLGWDSADNIRAIGRGWKTETFRDLHYQMHRLIGGKFSLKNGRIKHGMGAYFLRYNELYLFIRFLHDLSKPPVIGAFYYLFGYFKAMFSKQDFVLTKEESKVLRKLLWQSLFERFKNGDFYLLQKISSKKL
jgi:glycosyltransferase involved in cell wall biosynthesis